MSVWGSGPFEDDSSLDYLGEYIDMLKMHLSASLESGLGDLEGLYAAHSISCVLLCIRDAFGAPIGRAELKSWREQLDGTLGQAREKQRLRSLDEEMAEKFLNVLTKLAQHAHP
jgi:hypothetical protein